MKRESEKHKRMVESVRLREENEALKQRIRELQDRVKNTELNLLQQIKHQLDRSIYFPVDTSQDFELGFDTGMEQAVKIIDEKIMERTNKMPDTTAEKDLPEFIKTIRQFTKAAPGFTPERAKEFEADWVNFLNTLQKDVKKK